MPIIGVIDHRPMARVTVRILGCFRDMMGRGFPFRPEVATGSHTVTEVRKDIGTGRLIPHQVMAGQTVVVGVRDAISVRVRIRYLGARRDGLADQQMMAVGDCFVFDRKRFGVFMTISAVLFHQIGKQL